MSAFIFGKNRTLPSNFEEQIKTGSIDDIKAVYKKCRIDAFKKSGYPRKGTALHFEGIPLEIMSWLIDEGLAIDSDCPDGTPLFRQIHYADIERCRFLLDKGADIHHRDSFGYGALHEATQTPRKGIADIVKLLLEHGADPNARTDERERNVTPLLELLSRQTIVSLFNFEIIELLLNAQLDTLKRDTLPEDELSRIKEYVTQAGKQYEFLKKIWEEDRYNDHTEAIQKLYVLFDVPPVPSIPYFDGKSPIKLSTSGWEKQHGELWKLLVPPSGSARFVQGEVIRISGRTSFEIETNGAANWDKEFDTMLNALYGYLTSHSIPSFYTHEELRKRIDEILEVKGYMCEAEANYLCEAAVHWVIANPDSISLGHVEYRR